MPDVKLPSVSTSSETESELLQSASGMWILRRSRSCVAFGDCAVVAPKLTCFVSSNVPENARADRLGPGNWRVVCRTERG